MNLEGQIALVTGATSGIGLATAEAMSAAGMGLVLAGRRDELLAAHAARLGNCVHATGDITDGDFARGLFELALERYGRLDVVVNNAGQNHNGPIEEIDVDLVCQMVRTNVEAAYRVAYLAMKHFRATGAGHLINTSSVLGFKSRPGAGAYCGTKYAIEALAEALRMEVAGSGIKVTCIEPGLVVTDLHRDHAERPEKAQNVPRPLQPVDVARTVMFALDQPAHVYLPRLMVLPVDQVV
jgi:NADP-dependent 3-hydroxy acid dehydrogenase YdfG